MTKVLVGRDPVLGQLFEVIARGRDRSSGVVISGAPGMGKSALLQEMIAAATGFRVLRAEGTEIGAGYSFAGLNQLLTPLLPLSSNVAARHREVLESALALGVPVPHDDFAVAASVLGLLAAESEAGPLLVVIDDAQWIDTGSLNAILFAVRRLRDQPIAIAIAQRTDADRRAGLFAGLAEIELPALDAESARRLVIRSSRDDRHGVEVDRIVDICSGVPLALIELAAAEPASIADLEPGRSPDPITRLVNRLFGQRITALSQGAGTVALVAALEEPHEHDAQVRAARQLGATADDWDEVERSTVIRIHDGRIDFAHPLLRAAVLNRATPEQRRHGHEALADAMAARGDRARVLMHRSAATIGADEALATELENAAEDYLARAGHPAAANAFAESSRLSATAGERARRLLLAANAARRAGEHSRATALADEARRTSPDPIARSRAELIQGHIEARIGSTYEAFRCYQRVADQAARTAPDLAALALSYASSAAAVIGDVTGSLATATRADGIARELLSDDTAIAVRESLGSALALSGDAVRARPILTEVAQWYLAQESPAGAEYVAEALTWLGDFALARELLDDVAADARRSAAPGLLVQVLELRADLGFRTGDWSVALADATEAVSLAEDTNQTVLLAYSRAVLAILQGGRGAHREAQETAQQAREDARQHGLTVVDESASFALGAIELAAGHPENALVILEPIAADAVASGRNEPAVCLWAAEFIESLITVNRRHDAEVALDRLETQATRTGGAWAHGVAARYRGVLATDAEFDHDFTAAIDHHQRSAMPFELARTRLCYGQRLRRAGRRIDARSELRDALATFTSIRAAHWIGVAQRELMSTGERPRREPVTTLDALTTQELQIAQRIADGATNKEAAMDLFLSPKTIETHLTRIYRKLGVRSRSQLAHRIASSGPM